MEATARQAKRELLHRAGLNGSFPARRLPGGRNNRVWRLGATGQSLLLKEYFHGPEETRDRMGAEWGFLSFAWKAGLRSLPRPVAAAPEMHAALLGFLPGRRLGARRVTWGHVAQAADFIADLNRQRHAPAAQRLPLASEACLSLGQHLACLEGRVRRLGLVEDGPAGVFVARELLPAVEAVIAGLRRWALERRLELQPEMPQSGRCLSPSDFGFQNALLDRDGRLYFLDFEYAGWDDPAKLICDFLAQPEAEVDVQYLEPFAYRAFGDIFPLGPLLERTRAILPLHWLKWCCILLNEFLPGPAERRAHSGGREPDSGRRADQLDKARAHLRRLSDINPTR